MAVPETKRCTGECQQVLPESEFTHCKRANGKIYLQSKCRRCQSLYVQKWQEKHQDSVEASRRKQYRRNRAYVKNYLRTHPCVDCSEADTIVLEFDHVRGEKVAEIAAMVGWGYALERIIAEIEKCDVRCANCHRRVTNKRRKRSKNL